MFGTFNKINNRLLWRYLRDLVQYGFSDAGTEQAPVRTDYRLQPQCMISGRLGNDYVDFAVMADNEYPNYHLGVPWQTAASVFNESWGYRSWQKREECRRKLMKRLPVSLE